MQNFSPKYWVWMVAIAPPYFCPKRPLKISAKTHMCNNSAIWLQMQKRHFKGVMIKISHYIIYFLCDIDFYLHFPQVLSVSSPLMNKEQLKVTYNIYDQTKEKIKTGSIVTRSFSATRSFDFLSNSYVIVHSHFFT